MDSTFRNTLKPSMTYGIALGIIAVIFSLILYFFNVMPIGIVKPMLLFVFQVAIYFLGVLFFTKSIKKEVFGGTIDYRKALLVGLLIGFFTSIITSAYTYLQNVVIDPDYMSRYIDAQSQWMADYMYSKGLPDDQIEKTLEGLEAARETQVTFGSYIKSVLISTLGFGIISLITAAIVRTKESSNPFKEE